MQRRVCWRGERGPLRASRRRAAVVAIAFMLTAFHGPALRAQVIRGEVFDSLGARPLASVLIVLVDSGGAERDRALSDASGRFLLRAGTPGVFRLRSLVVGYHRWESEAFPLARGQSLERRVELSLIPIALPELTVEAERTCVVRPEEGLVAAALWGEIRTALEVTQLTIDRRRYRFRTAVTTRELDRYNTLLSTSTQPSVGYTALGFGSASAEDLRDRGFVRAAADGPIFFGPDARVLVSAAFLDEHCFRVEPGEISGTIGLAFEPVARRSVTDVQGTLWVDSASMVLRSLEWEYTGLSRWARGGDPGGVMEFDRLPNGAWFIRRWELRAPVGHVVAGRADTLFYGLKIREGQVTEVLTAAGDIVAQFDTTETRSSVGRR